MLYLAYNALLAAGLLLSLPYWLWKMVSVGKYRAGLGERLGWVPARVQRDAAQAMWVHAVSVGEVLAVAGMVELWRARHPEWAVYISTTTAAGQKLARERFGEKRVFYFPLDFGFAIGPWLRCIRPDLVVMAETEFWPNFLRLARRSGARVAVVNARISDRSLPGYLRWRRWLAPVLANVDVFLAQSATDAARLQKVGVASARVRVSGNLKFDARPPQASALADELHARFCTAKAGPVLVCGSTTAAPAGAKIASEEVVLLAAFAELLRELPAAVMVLAPRHPERFGEVAAMLQASGLRWWRRSQLHPDAALSGGVLLLDSIGELAPVYALAKVAFVGGSLVARGGHNILEPAHFAVPIVVGPHTENFRDMMRLFELDRAVEVMREAALDGDDSLQAGTVVAATWLRMLRDPELAALGERGQQVLQQQRGASERTLAALEELAAPAEAEATEARVRA